MRKFVCLAIVKAKKTMSKKSRLKTELLAEKESSKLNWRKVGVDDSWDKTDKGSDVVGDVIYGNSKEGIMVYSADGKAYSIIYYPTKKEKEIRCKKLRGSSVSKN
jgi:hypothetical protein